MFELFLIVCTALLLDALLGEPAGYHPLVAFGLMAEKLEQYLNTGVLLNRRLAGILALLLVIWPFYLLLCVQIYIGTGWLLDALLLYLAIGRRSLIEHAQRVAVALQKATLIEARQSLAYMVSRDTDKLSPQGVIKACIESVLENSNDAIYGAIFWYLLAGAPGVVLYRLVNTLDAMWGYKNKRFACFGWAAARLDDVMNFIPARLSVISFAMLGLFKGLSPVYTMQQAFKQGHACKSFNGGPVMASGALVLDVSLGGEAVYHGVKINKPCLGSHREAELADLYQAMSLLTQVCFLWLFILGSAALAESWWTTAIGS